ncbi:DNA polymerase delta subunit 4-like [Ruditapes philippinarum]|uniref:DNA polymerase delta subunit 4-like n=1 Tax=Ruditapes philippinarum TaxID=129788 RepID=UPI00295B00AA|nr:DNA polymerase delta subunit 4-like [Ruditapes philippinarum]
MSSNLITSSFKKVKQQQRNVKCERGSSPQPSCSKTEDRDMKMLKDFDLYWVFGPSMGISRLERWNRAEKHGLNPSPEVKQLVLAHEGDERYTQCLWNDYKNIM